MAGIYIHIPFCKQACHYCDFHFSTNLALQNDFTAALLKEIELRVSYLEGEPVETIYFGGGTPSYLPPAVILKLLESIRSHFPVVAGAEITLEANPDDMRPENLVAWKTSGINRLSIGIQSFFMEDLHWMNRAHTADQAVQAVENAKQTGFDNFSIDLIYGSPGLTDEKWQTNLETAIALHPAHISCYALTVEPKTALFKMIREKRSPDIVPETQSSQFFAGIRALEEAGYEHYEISSFAKPGKRSRHNSSYWDSKKYLGLGPSAHSFNGSSRQWNLANNALYVQGITNNQIHFTRESLEPRDRLNEYIMTSLRTREGLNLEYVSELFGAEKKWALGQQAEKYIRLEQMVRSGDRLALTREGKIFADGIAADLFFE
jgi:oxygen-independent coproporphyrinogen III oxidase